MSGAERIVGLAVADLVASEFHGERVLDGAPGIRLTGFREREILCIVERLIELDLRLQGEAEPVRLVVGSRGPRPGFPPNVFLEPGWTATAYRNHNRTGLVLIELDTQGDESGIQSMHTLSDSDVLNHIEQTTVRRRLRHIVSLAWQSAEPGNALDVPPQLLDVVEEIFGHVGRIRQPSLRTFVTYSAAVTARLVSLHRALTGPEIRDVAAEELSNLNLFRDPELFEAPTKIGRRLERNVHMSEMRTPQGKNVQDEQLGQWIDAVRLQDDHGSQLPTAEEEDLRQRMRGVLDAGGPDAAHEMDVRFWEQLFERRRNAIGLGTQIRAHLERHHSHRVEEFDALEVQDGLDDGDEAAALELLQTEASGGELALVDCLTPSLRKKVDRLAFQGERAEPDPLIAVLFGLNALDTEALDLQARTVTLELERSGRDATKSAQLFAFFYREVLEDVVEACDGAVGTRFEIDESIRNIPSIEGLFVDRDDPDREDEDAEDRSEQDWAPLRFKLTVTGTTTPLIRFRWDPSAVAGLAAFSFLVGTDGASRPLRFGTLDEWCDLSFDSIWPDPGEPVPEVAGELVRSWSRLNETHFPLWKRSGLSVSALDDYLDDWSPLLQAASERFVPQGGALAALDEFLDRDTATTDDGRFVLLGTHPLRLRWLRHHLENLGAFIRQALLGELRLNPENDSVYFHWIERVSPHRQPPVMSPGNQQLATSVREVQLHEEYALVPASDERVPDWLGAVDDASIDELVATTRSFLMAFPHKIAGLSVLLMSTSGAASTARRFVERLRQRDLSGLDLELHVATAGSEHDNVAIALAKLDSDEGRGQLLLPPFRLLLHDWDGGVPGAFAELNGRIDIAFAPNLFGLHSTALEETRRNEAGVGGRFDPWIDPATHSRPTDMHTINVSQVLLPATPDPLLENWSTLTVRRRRQQPVSAGDATSTDFVTLQVAFDKNEALFEQLHHVAHWVVTLDPFVGRDQIDALKNAPDVIIVKSGVGKNESNTLVVSSSAGRAWVTRQLARRLALDFGFEVQRAESIAERLYEIGRHVVPGLMLRAVGLGRTTEEILGLILARYAVDHFSTESRIWDGTEYWLSLDEHTDWFGGANRVRPDLLRVRLRRTNPGTQLELLVLESKFRQRFDLGAADEQVSGAMRLFDPTFQTNDPLDDAKFWRRELLTGLDELSRRPAPDADLPAVRVVGNATDERILMEDLRAGNYEFGRTDSIVCATAWGEHPGPDSPIDRTPAGHPLLRLGRATIMELLDRIQRGMPPAAPYLPVFGDPGSEEAIAEDSSAAFPDATSSTAAEAISSAEPGDESTVPVAERGAQAALVVGSTEPAASSVIGDSKVEDNHALSMVELEARYAKLLTKLDELGVGVDRPATQPVKEGPGFCLYRIAPRAGVSADRVTGKIDDIKLALELPADLNIRSYVDKGAVVFEVPKEDADRYYVSAQSLWDRSSDRKDALCVPIGEDIEGAIVELDFSSSDTPHLLIAGQTGSGKSIALETILSGLCRRKDPTQLQLLLVDPKSTELIGLAEDPHVRGEIGWMADEAIEMLSDGTVEMNRRYQLFRANRVRSLPDFNAAVAAEDQLPWWLIVLDEYADLTSDPDDRKAIETDLKRIAQKGRAAGVHLIVATQKPSAEVISTVIRSNLPSQLALRVKSSSDSRIILEEAGAESLAGKGDAFLRTAQGLRRLQCAMVKTD